MFLLLIKIPISSQNNTYNAAAWRSSSTQIKSPAGSSSEGDSRGATINKDKDNATVRLQANV